MKQKGVGLGLVVLAVLAGSAMAFRPKGSAPPPAASASASVASPVSPPTPVPSSSALDDAARVPTTEVHLAPAKDGTLGAWLLASSFRSGPNGLASSPEGVNEAELSPRLGTPVGHAKNSPHWRLAFSQDGTLDVDAPQSGHGNNRIAYAAATLHVEQSGSYVLLVGADDGVRVDVDGKQVFSRDEARPQRDDDDLLDLPLSAGDHPILLKLHQRDGAWSFKVRLLDRLDLAPPLGAYLALPGTSASDAAELTSRLATLGYHRGQTPEGYRPQLTVRYPAGAPRGTQARVKARLFEKRSPTEAQFNSDAGEVPIDARGAGELVVTLPPLVASDLARVEDRDWILEATVGSRTARFPFFPRRVVREAVAKADRVVAALGPERPAWLPAVSLDSVLHIRTRLHKAMDQGDPDADGLVLEAKELETLVAALEARKDPYAGRSGAMRRAYRSPADGALSEFGLYVPPSFAKGSSKSYPLIVGLHGMNGRAMTMLRRIFGYDDPGRTQDWEDRRTGSLQNLEAFVVTPDAHGNSMYRNIGEEDVLRVMDWALSTFPIDRSRVTITGLSMGGTGAASIPLHSPSRFAASEPLCGYHSYFIRRDTTGRSLRPWERLLMEERSNVSWAFNGQRLPLYIVHGKKDLPEENSGVLIDRYRALGYSAKHEHPDLGHNVWGETYKGLKGARWLLAHRRDEHPTSVRFRTMRTRWGASAWVHIDELSSPETWGEVQARIRPSNTIEVATKGVGVLRLDKDTKLIDATQPVVVKVDGSSLTFAAGESVVMQQDSSGWRAGAKEGLRKKGSVTGPIREVFHEPLLFVYGASDARQTRANEEVARSFARMRWGVRVDYPVMSDVEFFAKGEPLANDRALFLVGNALSNRVLRELEAGLMVKVEGNEVVLGSQRFRGKQLGVAFVRPNPRRPDRYVAVVEGVDALGTWRALSLPELLPDFVVYDEGLGASRGQQVLSAGAVRAAGFFGLDWSVPSRTEDPSAEVTRPGAKNEHDATSYLP